MKTLSPEDFSKGTIYLSSRQKFLIHELFEKTKIESSLSFWKDWEDIYKKIMPDISFL